MLVSVRAQQPLPLGGITGDGVHIWAADLKVIDHLLADDELIDILWHSARRVHPKARKTGRDRMALNRSLRTAALKHIKRWSFPDTFKELQRNLDYRAFTQFFDEKIPVASTLSRNLACIDAQAVRALNERLIELARQRAVVQGRVYRQDTTVCETNVHYPTDSSLLQDGVRVLQRLVGRAQELAPGLGRLRERAKAVRNRVLEIARAARGRSEQSKKRRESSYHALLRIVRPIVTGAGRIARKLGDQRVIRHLGWQEELVAEVLKADLDTMCERVERVIRQTRARVCRGITDWPDKLLSLFVPRTYVIRKGKAHKPNEFGRLIDIVEVENGIVSDYQVLCGNPDDGSLLIPAIERHQQRFGRAPHLVATDRGFWSASNERAAYALESSAWPFLPRARLRARGCASSVRVGFARRSGGGRRARAGSARSRTSSAWTAACIRMRTGERMTPWSAGSGGACLPTTWSSWPVRCGAWSQMSSRAEQRRDKTLKQLLELAPQMLFGSSSQTYRTCGNASCRCHSSGPRHGPHVYVNYKGEDGRTTGYYVPQALHERVHGGLSAWRKFQALSKEIAELNRQIMAAERPGKTRRQRN